MSRDIKERYAGSYLGILWNFLYPILFLILYWFVFSKIMRVRVQIQGQEGAYLPFLFSALFPWYAIQEGIIRGTNSLIEKGYIIKKVLLPYEIFPLSANIVAIIHYGIGFFLFIIGYILWRGSTNPIILLLLPILCILQLLFSSSWSLLFSSIAVYFRDTSHIIGIVMQGLFFLSPIIYPASALPENFRIFIQINPLSTLFESYRAIIILHTMPSLLNLLYFILFTILLFTISIYVFKKLKNGFADVL